MQCQFAHIETYARSTSRRARPGKLTPRRRWGIDDILTEAARRPDACPHVAEPRAPIFLLGSLEALQDAHDAMLAKLEAQSGRRVRRDQHTLLAIVASHPASPADLEDAEARRLVDEWVRLNLGFFIAWAEHRGGHLSCALLHLDEAHVHLHLYALPDRAAAGRAYRMHPGASARDNAIGDAKAEGMAARIAVRLGHRAYRTAMAAFQTEYWHAVGAPCGLLRDGPRRRRLPRAQYLAQQRALQAQLMAERAAEQALERLQATEALRYEHHRQMLAEKQAVAETAASHEASAEQIRVAHQHAWDWYRQAWKVREALASERSVIDEHRASAENASRRTEERAKAAETRERQVAVREVATDKALLRLRRQEQELAAREKRLQEQMHRFSTLGAGLVGRILGCPTGTISDETFTPPSTDRKPPRGSR